MQDWCRLTWQQTMTRPDTRLFIVFVSPHLSVNLSLQKYQYVWLWRTDSDSVGVSLENSVVFQNMTSFEIRA